MGNWSNSNGWSKDKKNRNKVLQYVLKFLVRMFSKTINNMKLKNLVGLYNSKYERWLYILSIPLSCLIVYSLNIFFPLWGYILAPMFYFLFKGFVQATKEILISYKYRSLYYLFDRKVAVVGVVYNKENKDKILTINSYIKRNELLKSKDSIEHCLNTNVLDIKQDLINKRVFNIITNKYSKVMKITNTVDKLTNTLREFNLSPEYISHNETDFFTRVKYRIETQIRDVNSVISDISFKVGKDVTMKLEDSYYVFEVKKNEKKIYALKDYVSKYDKKSKELPFVVGIDHSTGKLITLDLAKVLHIFINGITGSGKSCYLTV